MLGNIISMGLPMVLNAATEKALMQTSMKQYQTEIQKEMKGILDDIKSGKYPDPYGGIFTVDDKTKLASQKLKNFQQLVTTKFDQQKALSEAIVKDARYAQYDKELNAKVAEFLKTHTPSTPGAQTLKAEIEARQQMELDNLKLKYSPDSPEYKEALKNIQDKYALQLKGLADEFAKTDPDFFKKYEELKTEHNNYVREKETAILQKQQEQEYKYKEEALKRSDALQEQILNYSKDHMFDPDFQQKIQQMSQQFQENEERIALENQKSLLLSSTDGFPDNVRKVAKEEGAKFDKLAADYKFPDGPQIPADVKEAYQTLKEFENKAMLLLQKAQAGNLEDLVTIPTYNSADLARLQQEAAKAVGVDQDNIDISQFKFDQNSF